MDNITTMNNIASCNTCKQEKTQKVNYYIYVAIRNLFYCKINIIEEQYIKST